MAVSVVIQDQIYFLWGEVRVPLDPLHCHFLAPSKVAVVYLAHQDCFVLMNLTFFCEAGPFLAVELSHSVVLILD